MLAGTADFHVAVEEDGTQAVVAVHGEVDAATVPQLRATIIDLVDRGVRHVVVDLDAMTFIDSSGLGGLVGAARRLRDAGGDLALANPRPSVRRVFQLTGLDRAMNFVDLRGAEPDAEAATQAATAD